MDCQRYLGNTNKMEVHDLDFERLLCQIDKIIDSGHDRPFDTLGDAHDAGFNNCRHCLDDSTS